MKLSALIIFLIILLAVLIGAILGILTRLAVGGGVV
jgi:hypothetical protein